MSVIGFCGGCLMLESGTEYEMQSFFDALRSLSESVSSDMDWSLVLDRLYKRYVCLEDIDNTKQIMDYCSKALVKDVDDEENNLLKKYFKHFNRSMESAISFHETFGEYRPVKISVVDLPWYFLEGKRPLVEYDQLEGEPFWKRGYTETEIERLSNL